MAKHIARRRELLSTAAGVTALGLSGCLGGDENDDPSGDDGGDGGDGGGDGGDGGGNVDDSFPENDITMTVPYDSGGYDFYARLTAKYLQEFLDVSTVVENVAGSGGLVALNQVLRAEPDGYTHMIAHPWAWAMNQVVGVEEFDFDIRDLTYFGEIATTQPGICVRSGSGIETFDDYVEMTRAGDVTFASYGPTDQATIHPLLLANIGGADYEVDDVLDNIVYYDGSGEIINGFARGDVDVLATSVSSLHAAFIPSGEAELLIVGSTESELDGDSAGADTYATAGIENSEKLINMLTNRRTFAGPPGISDGKTETIRGWYESVLTDEALIQEGEEADRPVNYTSGQEAETAAEELLTGWEDEQDLLNRLLE